MRDNKKKLWYIRISVATLIIVFLLLWFNDMIEQAISFLLVSSGILGLVTKTNPFTPAPRNPTMNFRISYDDKSIAGPIFNIIAIISGIFIFFVSLL